MTDNAPNVIFVISLFDPYSGPLILHFLLSQYPWTHLHILSTLKAAWKCIGFVHCTSSQHVECFLRCCWEPCSNDLNNDLTCWAVRRFHKGSCWIMAENLWIRWALRVRGAQHVKRCCANALDFVELRMDDRETKKMLSRVELKVCPVSNLTQQDSTSPNTSQRSVQMRWTCRAQHVDSLYRGQIQCIWTRLKEWDLARLKISPLYANK